MRVLFINRDWKIAIAASLIVSVLFWSLGLSVFIPQARAAKLMEISDTLSDSDTSVAANHTLSFITKSVISASSTIVIDFADAFNSTSSPAFSILDATDYDIASSSVDLTVVAAGACPSTGAAQFQITWKI